ncbi:MAG: hypothetical protein R3211_00915, partial [Balneolaceae bacterium]|nr:hypothetical protein [Balneolaceae bacterium]
MNLPKASILLFAILLCTGKLHGQEPITVQKDGSMLLENFQDDSTGYFPAEWYDQKGNAKLINHDPDVVKDYHYTIVEKGENKFLRYAGANAKHINFPLVNKKKVDIYKTPILSWKARAH